MFLSHLECILAGLSHRFGRRNWHGLCHFMSASWDRAVEPRDSILRGEAVRQRCSSTIAGQGFLWEFDWEGGGRRSGICPVKTVWLEEDLHLRHSGQFGAPCLQPVAEILGIIVISAYISRNCRVFRYLHESTYAFYVVWWPTRAYVFLKERVSETCNYLILFACIFSFSTWLCTDILDICIYIYICIQKSCFQKHGLLTHATIPRRNARRLANKCGLILTINTKPGRHIPFDHPSLVHMREWISFQIQNGSVHERMVCNFDQTWSLNFVPRKTSMTHRQVKADPFAKNVHRKKLRHVIERTLGLDFTNSQAGDCGDYQERLHSVHGGPAAMNPVDQWRQPHTLTTLSWNDGSIGRGYVTVKGDYLSESQRSELNKELQTWLYIGPLQQRTHIWNSETFVEYMSFPHPGNTG